jgi:hypothetical protein
MSMKKIGLAAVLMLLAVSAMASNFRAADQVYIPAAGKVGNFATDVWVANVNSFPVTVSAIFATGTSPASTTCGVGQCFPGLFNLAAGERREFVDFVGSAPPNGLGLSNALGLIVFNGCKQGTDCGVATQDPTTGISPNFADISVESRIYATGAIAGFPTGTTGQLFSGLPWYSFVSQDQQNNGLDTVFITGIRANAAYRTNIGLVNASQFSTTTMVVKLFSATGTKFGNDFTITLGPLGSMAPTNVTTLFPGFSGSGFYATVQQQNSTATSDAPAGCGTSGCAGFFTYGSQLDNVTTDATTLEAQYPKSLTSLQISCIYPAPGDAPCKGTPKQRRSVRH